MRTLKLRVMGVFSVIGKGMERITITLSSRVVEKLDDYCDLMGQTRSTAIGSMVARQLVADESYVRLFRDAPEPDVLAEMDRRELVERGLIPDER